MKQRRAMPAEIVASLLAVTTVIISLPPYNLPPWAIFIGWAGTFAMGGPTMHNLRRIWPVMPVGSLTALLIVLCFQGASHFASGWAFVVMQMVILFVWNTAQLYLAAYVPVFSFAPGMFFGFASYFATFYGGFGPLPHNPFVAWIAVVLMNALGPVYAYLNVRWSTPRTAKEVEGMTEGRV